MDGDRMNREEWPRGSFETSRREPAPHDPGSGANETPDGLDSSNEALRHGAENVPIDTEGDSEDAPVFDRGQQPPKV